MLIVSKLYSKSNNEQYDTDMSDKIMSCKDKPQVITLRKMAHRILFQVLVGLIVLSVVFFNCIVKEWNSLPNHIREDNNYLKLFTMYL